MPEYTLWQNAGGQNAPVVFINVFEGNGEDIWQACQHAGCPPMHLVVVHSIDFNNDLTPWPAGPLCKGGQPFQGNGSRHLDWILHTAVPNVERELGRSLTHATIAGYSLAGLFALWSAWNTPFFQRIACVSGSLWYPDFLPFLKSSAMAAQPLSVYFSLGNKESHTRNPLMRKVEDTTREVCEYVSSLGIRTTFEMNEGNHFTQHVERTAKGIAWMLG